MAIRSPSSSASPNGPRFVPGTTLAERYRIVAMVGRGGMGEVYRADDLKLGQTVGLKLLPESLAQDGAALARFHREVRTARQVSHPNVCRVFDIVEADGMPLLTMEFVDGEDLASLLRRIGRLPADKGVEIARQLCAGLAAAHECGVIHRDLKPSNVMLDGRGKVRITDFGLAGVAEDFRADDARAGTPAYMAPEQLNGQEGTVQSDLYSLGLVLYEIFTGRRAYDAATLNELMHLREHSTPASPSTLVRDLDPLVERVILRCLEKDPRKRPSSALQVAAALPGGDPLAAALAAGETPSPEMVAAAGGEGALEPKSAWILAAAIVACLAVVIALAPHSTDLGVFRLDKTPDGLADHAKDVLRRLNYNENAADRAWWFMRAHDYLRYRAQQWGFGTLGPEREQALPGPAYFFYRQSPRPLVPFNLASVVSDSDPAPLTSGMATVVFDSQGRLSSFTAIPPEIDESRGPFPDPDFSMLFAEADLDPKRFRPAEPKWLPYAAFDARSAWNGSHSQITDIPVHVTAAAYHGKPVYFAVIWPWTRPTRMEETPKSWARRVSTATFFICGFLTLLLGAMFARKNIRLGRGDRKGAFRLAACSFSIAVLIWLLAAHHVADIPGEWSLFVRGMSSALFVSMFTWLYYMALEPYVRRHWPDLLISWSRLLAGGLHDPLVGRDFLVGTLIGAGMAIAIHITNGLPAWFRVPGQTPINFEPLALGPPQQVVVLLFAQMLAGGIFPALALMFSLLLTRRLLRRQWLAVVTTGLLVVAINLGSENFSVELPLAVVVAVLSVFTLLRFGILALAVVNACSSILVAFPLTLDFSRWYAGRTLFALAAILGMTAFGFRTALGNRPVFGTPLED